MRRSIAVVMVVAFAGCVGPKLEQRPLVASSSGPVCQGEKFPADAPCLEKGDPAPFAGILNTPETERAWIENDRSKAAENAELKKSNAFDVGLVAGAAVLILAAAYGGFELGRAVH
jgi:hypothetical protein